VSGRNVAAVEIGGQKIEPGQRRVLQLPLPRLYTHAEASLPVEVIHSKRPGPRLFVSAAIHGDELNGLEIVRRLLTARALKQLRGTLVCVPMVNVYGCLTHSRYLPDGRDLNRAFPGSESGSLAARLAHLFIQEIVSDSDYGIDLHTGARHRSNLPQIRAQLDDPTTREMAEAFGAPIMLNASLRDGSLRSAAQDLGVPILLYEAGEALRFDELCISAGVRGVLRVMRNIGMLTRSRSKRRYQPMLAPRSSWVRVPASGVVRHLRGLGASVAKGERLAIVSDPMGQEEQDVISPFDGIIIGASRMPLLHEGEALYHIADFSDDHDDNVVDAFQEHHDDQVADEWGEPLSY
jgi:hypothetical protein